MVCPAKIFVLGDKMSKARMEYAKELIQEKQYAKARAVLKEVDHPTARQWLIRLDELDPPRNQGFQPLYVLGVVAGFMIVVVLIVIAFQAGRSVTNQTIPTAAASLPTTASELVAPVAAEVSPSPTTEPTVTSTEIQATATITDTPQPTSTPRPTQTPRPTLTPRPTITPEPPFVQQVQQIGPIYDSLYDETYNIEVTLRSVDFTKGEGFEQLGAGRVYAITEITVRNLGPGSLRSISDFSFQMKDGNGAIRNASMFLMFVECQFDMVDLTAGGSISGCVAFEVPDTGSLELIYAPFQYEGLKPGRYISFRIR